MTASEVRGVRELRWFVGVPVGTNPLILADLIAVLGLLWAATAAAVSGIQFFFGSLTGAHVQWAALLGLYLVLLTAGLFFAAAFLLFQNRYVALYRFDDEHAYCESLRKRPGPLGESFHWMPFSVPPLLDSPKSSKRTAPWSEIRRIQPVAGMRVLLLKSDRGTVLRVYCPDGETYGRALAFAASKVGEAQSGGKGGEAA